jgi:hypothetical protein
LANEQYDLLLETISSGEYQALEHGEVELLIQKEGTELLRRLFQGHLDLRAANEAQHQSLIGSDQYSRSHHRQDTQRQLETLFGEVVVTRVGYSTKAAGVSALYPADGILNLATDRYSDGVSRRVAIEASKVSFSETMTTIAETTGAQVGKRQCEEITVKVAQDFSDFYAQRTQESPETTTDLLVLTTDGKGIVMHQKDLREATAKAAERAAQKSKVRLSPGQKRQRKRMATVASVYSTPRFERRAEQIIGEDIEKPERPAIRNKRVWASVREEAKEVIDSVFEEATRRDPQHQREWVVLVDGEPRQLKSIGVWSKVVG